MPTEPAPAASTQLIEVPYADADGQKRTVRVASPSGLLNVVPYLLGFHPHQSLVVVGRTSESKAVRVTYRVDLPPSNSPVLAAVGARQIVDVLVAEECSKAFVVGYGPEARVGPFVGQFRDLAVEHDITVPEILRAEGGRYWSYLCTDPRCCPPEGTPYEFAPGPELDVLAAGSVSGVLESREALAASVASATGADAAAMRRATKRAEARLGALLEWQVGQYPGNALAVREGIEAGLAAIRRYQGGGTLSRAEAAWLTVALRENQVCDDFLSRLAPEETVISLRLLRDLTRLARRGYVAPAASLLAFIAWQSGDGALGNIAVHRALADNPGYALADLIREALAACVPPRLARMPFTPEQVAAEYAKLAAAKTAGKSASNDPEHRQP